jgi:hypothetical protein
MHPHQTGRQDAIDTVDKKIKHWEAQKREIEQQAKASGVKTKAAKAKTMQLMKRRQVRSFVVLFNQQQFLSFVYHSTNALVQSEGSLHRVLQQQRRQRQKQQQCVCVCV